MTSFIFLGLAAFIVSLCSVLIIRGLARRRGWVAPVREDRWHTAQTALFGGTGIFFSFLASGLVAISLDASLRDLRLVAALLLGGLGSFLLGLFDDIYHISPAEKIVGQIVLASLFIFMGGNFQLTEGPILNVLLTYFWFIGIMNAINFLDNMDGLASGVVVISGAVLLALMLLEGNPITCAPILLTWIFVMSVLGFWVVNRHPASIFMGDAGSLFLGYTLAALAIPNSLRPFTPGLGYSSILTLLIPVTVLAIPIFDTTLVTFARALSGRSAAQGGKDHSSHRLVCLGFSEKISVYILYSLTMAGGGIAILMTIFPDVSVLLFGMYLVFLVVIGLYLGRKKVYIEDATSVHQQRRTPLITKIMYKKWMLEVVLDIILLAFAYYLAVFLQSDVEEASIYHFIGLTLPVAICLGVLMCRLSGIYRGIWDLLSIDDIYSFGKAAVLTAITTAITNAFLLALPFNWKIYFVFSVVLFFVLAGSRLSFRFLDNLIGNYQLSRRPFRILLYGAGMGGKLLVDEIKRNEVYRFVHPIGFLDDDLGKKGRRISGIKILGDPAVLHNLMTSARHDFKEVWISSPRIPRDKIATLRTLLPENVIVRRMQLDFIKVTNGSQGLADSYAKMPKTASTLERASASRTITKRLGPNFPSGTFGRSTT